MHGERQTTLPRASLPLGSWVASARRPTLRQDDLMLPAPTLDDVLRRAEIWGSPRPLRERLVSIVFAHPAALVLTGLESNRAFWDEETGTSWDLFFAGYYSYGSHGDEYPIDLGPSRGGEGRWTFSPRRFTRFADEVELATRRAHVDPPWRFGGDADLLSLMVYGGAPDWASLRAVGLHLNVATDGSKTLGAAVEGLRRWQSEEPDLSFAPGESPLGSTAPISSLATVLAWSASAVGAGIIGIRADAILGHLLH